MAVGMIRQGDLPLHVKRPRNVQGKPDQPNLPMLCAKGGVGLLFAMSATDTSLPASRIRAPVDAFASTVQYSRGPNPGCHLPVVRTIRALMSNIQGPLGFVNLVQIQLRRRHVLSTQKEVSGLPQQARWQGRGISLEQ